MAVYAQFYKHSNFGGSMESFTLNNNWRYWWIKFGSALGDEISSMRANAYSGYNGNVYGLTERNFLGKYAALNMDEGWTSWWSYVGGDLNDDIESALLINRNKNELVIGLKDQISATFVSGMDAAFAGTQVSRKGSPRIFSLFWPGHDPTKKFVSIEQNLNVALDWWPDYDAQVRYDIYLYLNGAGNVQGYVAWVYVWVEGGIFSGDIFDSLQPQLVSGASTLTSQLQSQLASLSAFSFSQLYLLPGPPPSSSFGDIGDAKSDSTLVLVW
ncbi:MAG: hypothetical protein GY803_25295 [Chloroflexi bacterium]|nr:hypothetical protein [Chloroflexota bacterium]